MKVVFLLDNQEYVEIAPEKLQLKQIAEGVAALGYEVQVPQGDGVNGEPQFETGFRPFINYEINITVPKPAQAVVTDVVQDKPKGKAKRKAN